MTNSSLLQGQHGQSCSHSHPQPVQSPWFLAAALATNLTKKSFNNPKNNAVYPPTEKPTLNPETSYEI